MLYIVPSRGRPENIRELLESFSATRTMARLWVCVDHDDPQLDRYQALEIPEWAALWVGARMRLGPTLNHYAAEYVAGTVGNSDSESELIGFMGDDHRPRTRGWDRLFQNYANEAGRPIVVYGNDLIQGRNLPTAVAMSASIVRKLDYFCPPGVVHLFLDNAWKEVGLALGALTYAADVVIEHMHPIAKKGEWDDLYKEVNSGAQWKADEDAYNAWLAEDEWREKLRALVAVSG